jgi:hypothetical protein
MTRKRWILPIAAAVSLAACTSTASETDSTQVSVVEQPSNYRPFLPEFTYLATYAPDVREECAKWNTVEACYDAYVAFYAESPTSDFEGDVLQAYLSYTAPTPRSNPTQNWQANQYGAHDDGRYLDDYGNWCDTDDTYYGSWYDGGIESDIPICPASDDDAREDAEWAAADRAADDWLDYAEYDYYDPGY